MKPLAVIMMLFVAFSGTAQDENNPTDPFQAPNLIQEERFKKVSAGMTGTQVEKIMGKPSGKKPRLWIYEGGLSGGEPHPVRDVYRIEFKNGKVVKKEKTISDCILEKPAP